MGNQTTLGGCPSPHINTLGLFNMGSTFTDDWWHSCSHTTSEPNASTEPAAAPHSETWRVGVFADAKGVSVQIGAPKNPTNDGFPPGVLFKPTKHGHQLRCKKTQVPTQNALNASLPERFTTKIAQTQRYSPKRNSGSATRLRKTFCGPLPGLWPFSKREVA